MGLLLDQQSIITTALPAANATASSAWLNLGPQGGVLNPAAQGTIGPASGGGKLECRVAWDALPDLTDGDAVTFNLQHSLDAGVSDAPASVPGVGNLSVTGGGSGAPAGEIRFYLPPDCKQQIRLQASVQNGGGNNTASNFYLELVL